jgi:hypothetical protein
MPPVVAAIVFAMLAIAGCGDASAPTASSDRPDPRDRLEPVLGDGLPAEARHPVTAVVEDLQTAFSRRDLDGICELLTDDGRLQAGSSGHRGPTSCRSGVRRLLAIVRDRADGWRLPGEPRVVAVEADGDRAQATVALDRRWQADVPLARRHGEWRLDSFFGVPPRAVERLTTTFRRRPFPPAAGGEVEVSRAGGEACPGLPPQPGPQASAGCGVGVSSGRIPLAVLTPLGYLQLEDCLVSYGVLVDGAGRTWTDSFDVDGTFGDACGDFNSCWIESAQDVMPWKGRIRSDGEGGLVHHTHVCIESAVGSFAGELVLPMERSGRGWRYEPVDGGGRTGFRLGGPLTFETDLDIRPASP